GCEKSTADARASDKLCDKVGNVYVFESQGSIRNDVYARAGEKLIQKKPEKIIFESQQCKEIITDFRSSDKIKEVMKRNLTDECHNI
ncbi:hypothetical protein PFAG_06055, partial [Plasmodium falciparum Santa Lucia]